jgi:hypothetical protein
MTEWYPSTPAYPVSFRSWQARLFVQLAFVVVSGQELDGKVVSGPTVSMDQILVRPQSRETESRECFRPSASNIRFAETISPGRRKGG